MYLMKKIKNKVLCFEEKLYLCRPIIIKNVKMLVFNVLFFLCDKRMMIYGRT